MSQYKDKAIVLRSINYSENDKILTLFGEHSGRFNVIAKGVRKLSGKNRAACQLFVCGDFLLNTGRSLDVVVQAAALEQFASIGRDLNKYAYANYLCELTYLLLPERENNERVFKLLLKTMRRLDEGCSRLLVSQFELKILSLMGYQPQLQHCCNCGREADHNPVILSYAQGGIVCSDCTDIQDKIIKIDLGTVSVLKYLLNSEVGRTDVLHLNMDQMNVVSYVTGELVVWCLGRHIKSLDFLRDLPPSDNI